MTSVVSAEDTPRYPGLGLSLRHYESDKGVYPMGVHYKCERAESNLVSVRELAMMVIMDELSDEAEWHKRVFDKQVILEWKVKFLSIPDGRWEGIARSRINPHDRDHNEDYPDTKLEGIITEETFEAIIKELQRKASYFEDTGIVPTLDACASVAKSDTLVPTKLHESLRAGFRTLSDSQMSSSSLAEDEALKLVVDPSMYPLVYGRSLVLRDELVGITDAISKWAGKGAVIEKEHSESHTESDPFETSYEVPRQFWSSTYQWLPANIALQDGTAKLTSYINNLHPKHTEIYRAIEDLIDVTLPMWDQCLVASWSDDEEEDGCAGRTECRMGYPESASDDNAENWIPSDPKELSHITVDWKEHNESRFRPWTYDAEEEVEEKWKLLRRPRIPQVPFEEIGYAPPGRRIIEKFKDTGLQIIVKIGSIELTPDHPDHSETDDWHVEGQMNERIVGCALYCFDSENVADSNISLRMQTEPGLDAELKVGENMYTWLQHIYGTNLGAGHYAPCLQEYGSVEIREGRLLAFPNVFHQSLSPLSLVDKTRPGHQRFIALYLVDPYQRIISTANVPPQQSEWWIQSVFGTSDRSYADAVSKMPTEVIDLIQRKLSSPALEVRKSGSLPLELMEMIRGFYDGGKCTLPMSLAEANEHLSNLRKERVDFETEINEEWYALEHWFA